MRKRSYLFLGAGGVGGYYGALLHLAGHPVCWLVRSDAQLWRTHGLLLESRGQRWRIENPEVYDSPADLPAADVVVVAWKTTSNQFLPEVLPRAVPSPNTPVVLMQNGLGSEEDAACVLGPNHPILGGLCFLCSHKVGPGHIRHLDYGMVTLASWSPTGAPTGPTPIAEQIAADLASAGVEVSVSPDLVLSRWKKLVWNIPFSGLCVALRTDTRKLVQDPSTRALARDLMREVQAGARALGRCIPDEFLDYMFELTDRMTPYAPSMQLDFEAGRPMEIEAIYERPVALARKHGAEMPRVDCLAQLLRFMEGHRSR